jgi:hypothetical protein
MVPVDYPGQWGDFDCVWNVLVIVPICFDGLNLKNHAARALHGVIFRHLRRTARAANDEIKLTSG